MQDSALYVLDIYPLSDGTDGSALVLPDPIEAKEAMSNLIPAPDTIQIEEFIKSSFFQ